MATEFKMPKMITWWRLDGSKVDMLVPEGGRWFIEDNRVRLQDETNRTISMIVLAPGEAAMRWEGPEGTKRTDYYWR